jgi:hypothetical protein
MAAQPAAAAPEAAIAAVLPAVDRRAARVAVALSRRPTPARAAAAARARLVVSPEALAGHLEVMVLREAHPVPPVGSLVPKARAAPSLLARAAAQPARREALAVVRQVPVRQARRPEARALANRQARDSRALAPETPDPDRLAFERLQRAER